MLAVNLLLMNKGESNETAEITLNNDIINGRIFSRILLQGSAWDATSLTRSQPAGTVRADSNSLVTVTVPALAILALTSEAPKESNPPSPQ